MSDHSLWEGIGDDEINSMFESQEYQHLTQGNNVSQGGASSSHPSQNPASSGYHRIPGPAGLVQDDLHGLPHPSETMYVFRPIPGPLGVTEYFSQPSESPSDRMIPGPAGMIQEARERKAADNRPERPTQEYLRDILTIPAEDPDFSRTAWLSAMEFAFPNGGNLILGDLRRHLERGKLRKVVAVIKTCVKNILGDLTCMLKDTTGEVSGTICSKVLDEVDGISVGCVLVIHNVSVLMGGRGRGPFALNITKKNLVKVFYKDGSIGPTLLDVSMST